MSPSRIVKTGLVWLVYVALCGVGALAFGTWVTWIDCRPLSDLPDEQIEVSQIPADALCYSVSHGRLLFSSREAIAENPTPFALTVAAWAALIALLVWPWLWNGLRTWARGRRRF